MPKRAGRTVRGSRGAHAIVGAPSLVAGFPTLFKRLQPGGDLPSKRWPGLPRHQWISWCASANDKETERAC